MLKSCSVAVLAAALVISGCSTTNDPTPSQVGTPSDSISVGASGGSLTLSDGARLEIPQGALSANVTIQITRIDAPANAAGPAYLLQPEGQTFAVPVTLTLPFSPEKMPVDAAPVVFTAPSGQSEFTELDATLVDPTHAEAQTTHFSVFYVGGHQLQPAVTLAAQENFPGAIAVDGAYAYWVNQGSTANPVLAGEGHIMRVPVAGGAATVLTPAQKDPKAVTFNSTSLFWTNGGTAGQGAGLMSAPLGGGAPTLLTPGSFPSGVAAGTGLVFFGDLELGQILSVPEAGGAATVLASAAKPRSVTVDGSTVFFSSAGAVTKVEASGGASVVLASGQNDPRGIAVKDGYVYWVNYGDGTIMRVAVGGGSVQQIVAGEDRPMSIVVDGQYAYWTSLGKGTVSRVPVAGGKVVTMARDLLEPVGIAQDQKNVYWTNNGKGVFQGSIMKVAK